MENAIEEILHTTHYDGNYALDESIREIWRKNTKEFASKGRIDIRQTEINSTEDLIDVFKIFRDTRFETFRIIFMRENEIVGSFSVSSRNPGRTAISKYYSKNVDTENSFIRTSQEIRDKIEKFNADGIYLLHNHPSGDPTPSRDDVQVTHRFKEAIGEDKILGHFIVSKKKLGFI